MVEVCNKGMKRDDEFQQMSLLTTMAVVFVAQYTVLGFTVWGMVMISCILFGLLQLLEGLRKMEEHHTDTVFGEYIRRWEDFVLGSEKLARCLLSGTMWTWIARVCTTVVYNEDAVTAWSFPILLGIWSSLLNGRGGIAT